MVNTNIISLYRDMITRLIVVILLKYIEVLNHYVVYQELIKCFGSIVLKKQIHGEKDQICGYLR